MASKSPLHLPNLPRTGLPIAALAELPIALVNTLTAACSSARNPPP